MMENEKFISLPFNPTEKDLLEAQEILMDRLFKTVNLRYKKDVKSS